MRIFLSTGEPSGDLHAANLIQSLRERRPDAEFVGFGGPRMAEAGATLLYPAGRPGGHVVRAGPANLPQVHRPARPGRPLLPRPAARRGRPDRLPGLQLVGRPAGQGARDPRLLLRPAADLGLGRLAGQEGPQVRRPRPVQPPVRAGLVPRPRRARARSTSAIPTSTSWPSGTLDEAFLGRAAPRAGRSWRSCPARGRRKSRGTCPIMLRAAAKLVAPVGPTSGSWSPACTSGTAPWPRSIVADVGAQAPDRGPRRADARADPPGRRRLGGLGLGRAGADGRGAADGRALQDQAVRPLGRPARSSRRSTSASSTCWPTPR